MRKKMIEELSDTIWDLAEVKFDTKVSCDLFVEILNNYGFIVERPYLDIEHAFKATWGEGQNSIGFLAEYDALDGISQQAHSFVPKQDINMKSSHACGHNLLGSAVLLAVLDLQEELQRNPKNAQIVIYGCPAEESGYAKALLAQRGAFDSLDMALTWHPHYINALWQDKTLAVTSLKITFQGQSSHAAMAPEQGRSALDSCELMNIGVNYLREHVKDDVRIHYAYLNAGGSSPNIVHKEASLIYFVRSFNQDTLDHTVKRVKEIAKGAAMMSDTTLHIELDASCASLLPNKVLSEVVYKHLKPSEYSSEALDIAQKFNPNIEKFKTLQEFKIDDYLYASTDVGDVSQKVPTCQFFLACEPYDCPMHSWQWAANGKSVLAHEGIIKAAKVLYDSALECIDNPQIIQKAKLEFELRKENKYV